MYFAGKRNKLAHFKVHKLADEPQVRLFESVTFPDQFLRLQGSRCDVTVRISFLFPMILSSLMYMYVIEYFGVGPGQGRKRSQLPLPGAEGQGQRLRVSGVGGVARHDGGFDEGGEDPADGRHGRSEHAPVRRSHQVWVAEHVPSVLSFSVLIIFFRGQTAWLAQHFRNRSRGSRAGTATSWVKEEHQATSKNTDPRLGRRPGVVSRQREIRRCVLSGAPRWKLVAVWRSTVYERVSVRRRDARWCCEWCRSCRRVAMFC